MNLPVEWKDRPVKYLRDKVVDQLKYNFANNHLETEEFEQLVKIALSTPSKSELMSLTADLPQKDIVPTSEKDQDLMPYVEEKSIVTVLSATKQKGIWSPTKQVRLLTVLGDAEIDFRDVHLDSDVTYISLFCCLGNVKIIVPPGVNVVTNVKNILGAFENDSRGKLDPESPTIVIEGKVVLGNAEIWRS